MNGLVFLHPGQGVQAPRMGLALAESFEPASALLDVATEETGLDIRALLRRGGAALEQTEVLQPVMTAVSLGASLALRHRGAAPRWFAGHSLGEVAAVCDAGACDPSDAVRLAAARGRLMSAAARAHPGGMVALVDVDEGVVDEAVRAGEAHGSVVVAGHNSTRAWTLSGDARALAEIERRFGARRIRVSGAWHSAAMNSAVEPLRLAVAACVGQGRATGWASSLVGRLATGEDDLPDLLAQVVVRPLAWVATLRALAMAGGATFVTVGPGKTLRAQVRQVLGRDVTVLGTESVADLDKTASALVGHR